jgi:ABC-type transport system involved in multi-copper enzyme maturation permease subunit
MSGRIYAIALNTFREAIRQRVLYGILVVALGLNLFSLVLGEMSLHEEARVARDVGLGGVSLFGSVIAIVLGVSLLYGEIQRRTIHTIVSKPIARFEFVLGKSLGMVATLSLLVVVFVVEMALVLKLQEVPLSERLGKAIVLAYVEVLIVAAIAIFFSSFSSPFLAGIFTFGLFFVGRVTPELRAAADTAKNEAVRVVCKGALRVVPDLHMFGISGTAIDGKHVSVNAGDFVPWSYVGTASAYGAVYVGILLVLAILIFARRDFV